MTLFEFSCQITLIQAALIKHGVEEEKRLAILEEITKGMIQQIEQIDPTCAASCGSGLNRG
jgi:hypothetical protein